MFVSIPVSKFCFCFNLNCDGHYKYCIVFRSEHEWLPFIYGFISHAPSRWQGDVSWTEKLLSSQTLPDWTQSDNDRTTIVYPLYIKYGTVLFKVHLFRRSALHVYPADGRNDVQYVFITVYRYAFSKNGITFIHTHLRCIAAALLWSSIVCCPLSQSKFSTGLFFVSSTGPLDFCPRRADIWSEKWQYICIWTQRLEWSLNFIIYFSNLWLYFVVATRLLYLWCGKICGSQNPHL